MTFEFILPNLQQLQGYQPMLRYFWSDGLFDTPDERYFRLVNRGNEMHRFVQPALLAGSHGYLPKDAYCDLFNEGRLGSYINKMTRFDMLTLLPALLHVEDRTSMAVSLESRVYLCWIIALPNWLLPCHPRSSIKVDVRSMFFGKVVQHVVPDQIYNRKDKMGFPVPLNEWYARNPVRDFVHATLSSLRARRNGFLQGVDVDSLLDTERAFGRNVWGLLSLEIWMQTFLDGNYRSLAAG